MDILYCVLFLCSGMVYVLSGFPLSIYGVFFLLVGCAFFFESVGKELLLKKSGVQNDE